MKLWLISDLHIGPGLFWPTIPDADVCVIAGDVLEGAIPSMEWIRYELKPPMPVIYVLGNHEFYGSSIERELHLAQQNAAVSGINLLDNDTVTIGGVRFVGGTGWTDYNLYADGDEGQRSLAMPQAYLGLNDHARIMLRDFSSEVFEPSHALEMHVKTGAYIEGVLHRPHDGATIVVTHHAPSPKSITSQFAGDGLSPAFASDLEPLMIRHRPDLWLHGHVHTSHDYAVGATRVVCNPRGYGDENEGDFDPGLVVEV